MQGSLRVSWVAVRGYCVRAGEEAEDIKYPNLPPAGANHCGEVWVCRTATSTYVASLYIVSSVSAIVASPGNFVEQITAILLMLAGGTLWAQVPGTRAHAPAMCTRCPPLRRTSSLR